LSQLFECTIIFKLEPIYPFLHSIYLEIFCVSPVQCIVADYVLLAYWGSPMTPLCTKTNVEMEIALVHTSGDRCCNHSCW